MNKNYEKLESFLKKAESFYLKNHLLKYNTYFKTGGIVKFFIKPKKINEFKEIVSFLYNNNLKYKIIGFTSNVIFLDNVTYSIIISTKLLSNVEIINDVINVTSGYSVQDFVRLAIINQSKGFEGLEGIPASIGGAIFMNAGAYGDSISDNLVSVDCIDEHNSFITLTKEQCNFSYRNSIFKSGKYIILQAKFKLIKGNREEIEQNIETYHIARHSYQDFVFPNLGSMLSIIGDTYYLVLKKDKVYTFYYWILKYLYKNPIVKFINRKKPNNKIFNRLLLKYLKNKKGIKLKYKLSPKNSNILINDGSLSTLELINYMLLIHDLIDKEFHIENEIITKPIHSIDDSFKEDYLYIIKKLKEHNENSLNNNS